MSTDAAYASWLSQWHAERPEARLLELYCTAARTPGMRAAGVLEHLLCEAAFGLRDPAVAARKLGWWAEELARAAEHLPHHPVARELVATLGVDSCRNLARAALSLALACDGEPPADAAGLLARYAPAAEGFATIYGAAGDGATLAAAWIVDELRAFGRFAEPAHARVPLVHLARAGCGRVELLATENLAAAASTVRRLAAELAARLPGASLPAGLLASRLVIARIWAERLQRTRSDRALVEGVLRVPRIRLVLALWRARS